MTEGAFDELISRHPALTPLAGALADSFDLLSGCARGGGFVYVCGNGGSAADAEHIVGELMKGMGRRRPLPEEDRRAIARAVSDGFDEESTYLAERTEAAVRALCLSSQSALLTAVANDTGGDMGFAQQVHAYGRPGDVLWAISTSGRSRNVVLAALAARARGVRVLALTGAPGLPLGSLADVWLKVDVADVAGAQELHRPVYHAICEALEESLFPDDPAL